MDLLERVQDEMKCPNERLKVSESRDIMDKPCLQVRRWMQSQCGATRHLREPRLLLVPEFIINSNWRRAKLRIHRLPPQTQ